MATIEKVTTRDAVPSDDEFLRRMLYEAASWNPDWPREPMEDVLAEPVMARFHEGWGRAGDAGVVAELDGEAVGAAWSRLFKADAPGYGFVDEQTPELGLAVVPLHRRAGIGTVLLDALIERSARGGLPRSLSRSPSRTARG